jgi:hypothetical protein
MCHFRHVKQRYCVVKLLYETSIVSFILDYWTTQLLFCSNKGKRNNRNAVISNLCKELQPLQGISRKKIQV